VTAADTSEQAARPPVPEAGDQVFDARPPGERYFRHPGDVVRLVLWGSAALALGVVIAVGTATTDGITTDLGQVAGRVAVSIRELLLALTQVVVITVTALVVAGLVLRRRWRRLGVVLLSAGAGAAAWAVVAALVDLPGRLEDAVTSGTWIASTRFPSPTYVAAAAAAAMVGKPWMGRPWRRAADISLAALVVVLASAGSGGVPELLLAVATGSTVGAALLVAFGAPNRRAPAAAVATALRDAGIEATGLELVRAQGGRAQLYIVERSDGSRSFVKVYGRDTRDADFLYRAYRAALLRGPNDNWPSLSLKHDVEREALLLMLAGTGGVTCPRVDGLASIPDGTVVLALQYIDGPLLEAAGDALDDELLDATWREVRTLHERRIAHRSLRAANIIAGEDHPVLIDFGFGEESAPDRTMAIDRAELLASLAVLVGPPRAVSSAVRVIGPEAVATALPYLQPLALSASTRKQAKKALLRELRVEIENATGQETVPLERLVRVQPRTLLMITALVGAFYVLLPQLANVGDSFRAIRTANFGWLAVAAVMSALTYLASAIGMAGGVRPHIPFVPNLQAQAASTFVNRVTPANVGGMALNVRFLQKAGVDPAEAVTGVGLNSVAGAIVHIALLVVFFAWAGQKGNSFSIPSSSKLLVIIAVVLALAGIVAATRRGRALLKTHVLGAAKRSFSGLAGVATSPAKLTALFGGSGGVTLAYIAALAASVAAFENNVTLAQVGAVYLGASVIAAAAPTPGGLGALEAAIVAGLTGVGMPSGDAVAAVLAFRLITYWLPIIPGWLCLHAMERRGLI
jgi:undecaprenyl-diphosphatase